EGKGIQHDLGGCRGGGVMVDQSNTIRMANKDGGNGHLLSARARARVKNGVTTRHMVIEYGKGSARLLCIQYLGAEVADASFHQGSFTGKGARGPGVTAGDIPGIHCTGREILILDFLSHRDRRAKTRSPEGDILQSR